jgi:N-acetylmuramoyl-L-alanine amidase
MRSISMTLSERICGGKLRSLASLLAVVAVALLLGGCAGSGVRNSARKFNTVVIDAGHGGHDQGTRSSRYMREKDAALDVALRLEKKVRAAGFKTVMTRTGDYFVTLDDRVRLSNRRNNAIFVSVHFNEARRRPDISGAEVYYHSAQSVELAQRTLNHVGSIPASKGRFTKQARFRVLRLNKNPAILIEGGYFSNRGEAARFANPEYRDTLADAITKALVEQKKAR